MRGIGTIGGVGTLLLALACGPAAAQEPVAASAARSVESAQEFLRQVLPGNRYVSTAMTEVLARAMREGLRGRFEPLPVIVEAEPVAPCRSRLLADIAPTWLTIRDPAMYEVVESSLADLFGDATVGNPDGMAFGDVRALRVEGARVHLRFAGEQHDAVVHMESTEMAGRVHAAIDFLRRECDLSARTGF